MDSNHKLHHAYTWPIRTLLKGIGIVTGNKKLKDKEYREKLGKIVKGEDKPDREKGWLNKYFDNISTTKKVQENVNRIKGLLK